MRSVTLVWTSVTDRYFRYTRLTRASSENISYRQPFSYSSSSQLAGKAADTDDGAGRSSFGIFSHPPSLMHCINSTHRDTNGSTSVFNTMVEGVNGYGILTDNGTCLNHLKYPVTHNLISYRDYRQSLLPHIHSPIGGIVHASYIYQSY